MAWFWLSIFLFFSNHHYYQEPRPASSRLTTNRSLDLKRVKMVISEHNDKTLKQMTVVQQTKKALHKPKSDPMERKLQDDKQTTTDTTTTRPKSWPNKIEVISSIFMKLQNFEN